MYDPDVRPTIFNEFSTAAFRFGHSLISDLIKLSKTNQGEDDEELTLAGNFFNTDVLQKKKIGNLAMGMLHQPSEPVDAAISSAVREHLFQRPNASFGNDLASLNIQRGRDHGIASYDTVRGQCGMSRLSTFSNKPDEIPQELWNRFSELYDSPLDIELFPAGLSETPESGILGPTFTCIIAQQFRNLVVGDRYFFTHSNVPNDIKFCEREIEAIKKRTLRDVMCDNFGIKMQKVARNPLMLVDEFSNPLDECDGAMNLLEVGDLCLFNGEAPTPLPAPSKGNSPF